MEKKIFTPITIGSLEVKNRLVVSAMVTHYCDEEGCATERYIAYHEAKAKGGWGLIITEDYRIAPEAGASPTLPGLWCDEQIPSHRELTERIHQAGGKIVAQIYHAGWDSKRALTGVKPIGVTAVKNQIMADMPEALSKEQIQTLIEQFAQCARRVKAAGFDGVEIHGAHGYLLNQFFSPLLNSRSDEYGGNFQGRARFPLEVVRAVRAAVGDDYPIIYRMTSVEATNGGLGIEESKALAVLLEDAGVDAINCSQGGFGCRQMVIPPSIVAPGAYIDNAQEIKSVVTIPVFGVGRVNTWQVAEAIVRSNKADLVVMGRASIADPALPQKALNGRDDEIRHCIGCVQGCIGENLKGNCVSCLVNPMVGHEAEYTLTPVAVPKRIFIAGGGVAGAQAAITAAQRGHQVTLFEQSDHLGGQWQLASVPIGKAEFASFILWQKREMERQGVTVKLQCPLTAAIIAQEKPDTVIIATGSKPSIPPIKGLAEAGAVTAHDILAGTQTAGKNVVVIGGGLVGAETAEFLAAHGSQVTILEALPQIAKDAEPNSKFYLLENLQKHHVQIFTGAKVQEVKDHAVYFHDGQQQQIIPSVDTIVIAAGVKPYNPLVRELETFDVPKIVIGDALDAKNGLYNIREGFLAGLRV